MFRIRQFLTLTRLTAVDVIRQPIYLLLAATCVLLTTATPLMVIYKFGEEGKLARDSGLAFHFVFGMLIAGYAAGSSLARELRSGTAAAVLSKPVSREILFLAKFAGVACVILLFSTCAALTTLLSERIDEKFMWTPGLNGLRIDWRTGILLLAVPAAACLLAALVNYVWRRPFGSTAFAFLILCILTVFVSSGFFDRFGRWAPFDYRVEWRILPASLLITLALLVLAAIAVALSTRFGAATILAVCAAIFLGGLMSDYLLGRHAADSNLAAFFYALIPNWQHFWLSDALSGEGRIPWSYVKQCSTYAAVYTAGVVCLGMLSFRHAEAWRVR